VAAIFARVHALNPSSPLPDPRDSGPSSKFPGSVTPADAILGWLRRYVVMTAHEYIVCVLDILHTFVFDQFEITPRLLIRGMPKSGKTTLLKFIGKLASLPKKLGNVRAAVLYWELDVQPKQTLLLDEFHNLRDGEAQGTVWAIWNDGYEKGGTLSRIIDGRPKEFDLFGPVVAAYTERDKAVPIPEECLSRCHIVRLKHLTPEQVKTLKLKNIRVLAPDDQQTFNGIYQFAARVMREAKLNPDPVMPDDIDLRHGNNWRVLISIADFLGDGWGKLAREACVAFAYQAEETRSEKALRHCLAIYNDEGVETSVPSPQLIMKLHSYGPAEGEWQGLTVKGLAGLIGKNTFELKTKQDWPSGPRRPKSSWWGYMRADLEQAARVHLREPPSSATEPRLRLVSSDTDRPA
jgi:hypothetical protein